MMGAWITTRTPRPGSYVKAFGIRGKLVYATIYVFKDQSSSLVWKLTPPRSCHKHVSELVDYIVRDDLDVEQAELEFRS